MNRLETQMPGIEPISSQPIGVQVDVAGDEVAEPGDPEQRGRVEDVRADDLRARVSGKTNTITSPKNVPLPTEVRPTMKPKTAPIATAAILSAALEDESARRSAACRA